MMRMNERTVFLIIAILFLLIMVISLFILHQKRTVKVPENRALVIYGRKQITHDKKGDRRIIGYKVVSKGKVFIQPIIEKRGELVLETLNFDFNIKLENPIRIEGKVKIKEDDLIKAAEFWTDKGKDDIIGFCKKNIEIHIRKSIPTDLTSVKENVVINFETVGLELLSLNM